MPGKAEKQREIWYKGLTSYRYFSKYLPINVLIINRDHLPIGLPVI